MLVACAMRSPLTGVGSLLPVISADLDLSSAAAGALTSLPLVAFAASSLVVPKVAARFGQRPTLVAALFLLVFGVALRWAPGVVPLFLGTAILGVAIAVANVLLPALIRTEFPGRIALLTSTYVVLMQVAGSLASGVAVPLAEVLPGGWRTSMVLWGIPALAVALLWLPLVRGTSRPATAGTHARTPWRSATAWWVTAYMALQSLIFYVLLAWLATMTSERSGLDATEAGVVLSVMQVAGVVGSLVVPVLAGRSVTRTRWVAVGATGFSVAGLTLLLVAPDSAYVAIVVAGLGMGGSVVLALAAVSARAADGPGAVALSGMAQAVGYLAAAVGPVVIGGLHSVSGAWTVPLALLFVCALAQLPASWAANRDRLVVDR